MYRKFLKEDHKIPSLYTQLKR